MHNITKYYGNGYFIRFFSVRIQRTALITLVHHHIYLTVQYIIIRVGDAIPSRGLPGE